MRQRFRAAALLLALAGALHGALYVPLVSTNVRTDSWTYSAAADAILDGSYTTPLKAGFFYVYPAGWFDLTGARIDRRAWQAPERQVFRPPGYPAFLAALGGGGTLFEAPLQALLAQVVLFGAGALLLVFTVRRWWGETCALVAGALYAVDPWSKHYVPLLLTEALAGFLVLALAYVCTRAFESRAPAWWAAAGATAAALTLVRAVFVLVVPLVVLAALVRTRAGAVAALAASAVLLVPWLAWTTSVVGTPVLASWGEGFNLLLAAQGEGHGHSAAEIEGSTPFEQELRSVRRLAPPARELLRDPQAHPRYLRRADAELRAAARSRYLDRLADEPLAVAWEAVYRAFFLWNAHEDWYQPDGAALLALRALDWALLLLALGGAGIALARGGAGAAAVVLLLAYTGVLAVHHVEARFAIPLRGLFLALVALALAELGLRLRSG